MRLGLQIGAGLALAMMLGLLALGLPMRQQAMQNAAAQHDLHVGLRLQTLVAEIEARLSYGYALAEIATIQDVLETVQAGDPAIQVIEVFSVSGVTLFSTDRALIGDRVDPALLQHGDAAGGMGLSLHNDLGEEVGFIRLGSTGAVVPADLARGLDGVLILGLAVLAAAGLGLGALSVRAAQQNARAFVAGLAGHAGAGMAGTDLGSADLGSAGLGSAVLAQIQVAEDRLDQLSQQLAGADDDPDDAR